MNKLEDGLNQLKENEQAYLDGQQQIADGEEALADAEKQLADGEKTLAEGEAAYAAAPGQLAEGRKSLSDLEKLISGLNLAYRSFNNYSVDSKGNKGTSWKDGFEHKVSDGTLAKIAAGQKTCDSPGLRQARGVITQTVKAKAEDVALIETVAKSTPGTLGKEFSNAKTYAQFDRATTSASKTFGVAIATLTQFSTLARTKATELGGAAAQISGAKAEVQGLTSTQMSAAMRQTEQSLKTNYGIDIKDKSDADLAAIIEQQSALKDTIENYIGLRTLVAGRNAVVGQVNTFMAQAGDYLPMVAKLNKDAADAINYNVTVLKGDPTNAQFAAALSNTPSAGNPVPGLAQCLSGIADVLDSKIKEAQSSKDTFDAWHSGYDQLAAGQAQLADTTSGIPYAFSQMRSNKTLRTAIKGASPSLYKALGKYTGSRLKNDDMDKFDSDMAEVSSLIKKALPILYKVRANGQKDYKEGLAAYKAAPAQLAEGRAALADGYKQYEDGKKQLEEGKKQLAQYEDGEQQVRDGLATLMATEADPGLESILERRNGDDKFDDENNHLDLDEGLEAVEVGRGYQADSGDLITKEITNRAVGTAAGLGAGALAVLAAILSFLKKNKGAAISAVLAAVAGGVGAAVGMGAGEYYSDIAGSTVGNTPFIAAGVLAAVAAVFAIIHFTAKPEAKETK